MIKKFLGALALIGLLSSPALATNCSSFTYTLTNGTTADANQVMSNFNTLLSCANNNLAHNGANSDITSLSGLSTPLSTAQGGTGLGSPGAAGSFLTSNGTNWQSATVGNGIVSGASGVVSIDPSFLRNYIGGLTLSNDGVAPNTVIDVAAGAATDSANAVWMKLAAFTKNMNSAWVVGSGNGCADGANSYTALGASTWYAVFEISRNDTGVVDVLCSKSATAPTLPTNYNNFRRLGSIKTDGSSHILTFSQNGYEFLWGTMVNDLNVTSTDTIAHLVTLSIPTGIKVNALFSAQSNSSSSTIMISSPDVSDIASTGVLMTNQGNPTASQMNVRSNTSGQIRYRFQNNNTIVLFLNTQGWIDSSIPLGQ